MQYDEKVLNEYCERLYLKASNIENTAYIVGFLIFVIVSGAQYKLSENPVIAVFLGLFFGFVVGAVIYGRAFSYRFQAQNILVLCQIERNTRKD